MNSYSLPHWSPISTLLLVLTIVLASLFPSSPAAEPSSGASFLQAHGATLFWHGQPIVLKGTNFDNIGALGAGIGTGNIDDIAFNEADYAELARQGANHARFGLSFNWYQQDQARFFLALDQHIAWAKHHGIFLVFNMFTTPGNCYEGYSHHCGFWGSHAEQQELQHFWVAMAQRYKAEPGVAGYDLLNEPTPPQGCHQWFQTAQRIRDAVYAVAPNQLVFVNTCSDPNNDLRYNGPPRGANIVYEVHDYAPMDMSHDFFSTGSVYPGFASEWYGRCYVDKATFAGMIHAGDPPPCAAAGLRASYGLDWAAQNDVPIYIGEWGATSRLNGYVQYHADKAELYRDWGVHHAHYTWKHQTIRTGGFYQWGIYSAPLNLDDPAKLEAVKISWQGAVRPHFGTNPPLPVTPRATSTAAPPPGTATPQPTNQTRTPSLPTQTPAVTSVTVTPLVGATHTPVLDGAGRVFERAVNIGGSAVVIDGAQWAADAPGSLGDADDDSYSLNGRPLAHPWLHLAPATDASRTTMLQDWRQHWMMDIAISAPDGQYDVYVYTLQGGGTPIPEPATLSLEGRRVGSYVAGTSGSWERLGPYTAQVSDGSISLAIRGLFNLAGVEVWQHGTDAPSFYRAINVNGEQLVIDGNTWLADPHVPGGDDGGSSPAPGFSINGFWLSNRWMQLEPPVPDQIAAVLQDWRQHWAFDLTLSVTPGTTYEIFVYVVQDWNDPNPETSTIWLEGQPVATYTPAGAGTWRRLGPFAVTPIDDTLNLTTRGLLNLAGVEVWRVP
jgi:hypothetical protein